MGALYRHSDTRQALDPVSDNWRPCGFVPVPCGRTIPLVVYRSDTRKVRQIGPSDRKRIHRDPLGRQYRKTDRRQGWCSVVHEGGQAWHSLYVAATIRRSRLDGIYALHCRREGQRPAGVPSCRSQHADTPSRRRHPASPKRWRDCAGLPRPGGSSCVGDWNPVTQRCPKRPIIVQTI